MNTFRIAAREIGPERPAYLIAEAGVNHNGSLENAAQLVRAAVRAGVDAVKFQTFRADRIASAEAPKAEYQRRSDLPEESQLEMLRALELDESAHRKLMRLCQESNIEFLSTPFDEESADLLADLGVRAIKVSSGELTNSLLLSHLAGKGLPLILSTGMSDLEEVREALEIVRGSGAPPTALLHCVSCYPAAPAAANLRAMATLEREFSVPAGFSDHTTGLSVSFAAAALGARIIEKHFTLDRKSPGPDHAFSLEPDELAAWVEGVRAVEISLGDGRKVPAEGEAEIARIARRSLAAACDLPAGSRLELCHLAALRPGTGIPPSRAAELVGKTLVREVSKGGLFSEDMLQ